MAQLGSTTIFGDLITTGSTVNNGPVEIYFNSSSPIYNNGHIELISTNSSSVSIGFNRSGNTACQLRHDSNGLILSGTNRTAAADFYAYGNITAYSDERLKKDLEIIPNALDKILCLNGYTFKRTNSEKDHENKRHTGLIAQEVQKVLPEAVSVDKDGYLSLAYGNMVGLLIEAIKDQQKQIEDLKEEVKRLGS